MIAEVLFIFWRLTEIVFLIPIIGMLAYFVNGFLNANELTPAYILILFIVSTIAVFWCIDTILRFGSTRRSAIFVAFLDLCFFGALIAGVYQLRFIAGASCTSWSNSTSSVSLGPFGSIVYTGETPNFNKTCSMLKASFAMGIMEVVFFFITAFFALLIHRHHRDTVVKETVVRRRSHSSRRGHHRSRSGSSSRRHYVV